MSAPDVLLSARGIEAGYGASQVLFGVDLEIYPGQVVALLGRNGMGKSTTIKTLTGTLATQAGEVRFGGERISGTPVDQIARRGIAIVPEGRQVFPNLTVREHLLAFADNRNGQRDSWTLPRLYALFPRLKERERNLGNQLSGGEQQMVAIARALMTNPRILLLDEPMEGLAPIIVQELVRVIRKLVQEEGLSVIVVEQHARLALSLTQRAIVLDRGRIVHDSDSASLLADGDKLDRLVAVA